MNPQILEAAQAFSGHDFEAATALLADDVRWDNIGGPQYEGKDAVVGACRDAAGHLAGVTTTFLSSRMLTGEDHVVIDSLAQYVESDGDATKVGSCDMYTVADGQIATITSYNVAVDS